MRVNALAAEVAPGELRLTVAPFWEALMSWQVVLELEEVVKNLVSAPEGHSQFVGPVWRNNPPAEV